MRQNGEESDHLCRYHDKAALPLQPCYDRNPNQRQVHLINQIYFALQSS